MFFKIIISVEPLEQLYIRNRNKLTYFSVIAKNSVEIVFDQIIDKIKEINRNYVTI